MPSLHIPGFFYLLLLLPVIAAVVALAARQKGRIGFPYQRSKALFSAAERSFLGVLDQAVGAEYRVFGKVRVADVASVRAGVSGAARQGALNRIAGKHFDFIVCRTSDLSIVCAVELNDKSHASGRAKSRDQFVVELCRVIGLPLLTYPAKANYALADVRAQFLAALVHKVLPAGAAATSK
jgi:hypothetical protein